MKKVLFSILFTLGILGGSLALTHTPAYADSNNACDVADAETKEILGCNSTKDKGGIATFAKPLLQTAIGLVGVTAVIILIISGATMATSHGDPSKFAKARNAVIYSAIGLTVAILSFTIVSFVLDKTVSNGSNSSSSSSTNN